MKTSYFTSIFTLTCLLGLCGSALARENAHLVEISNAVAIGGTRLKPGNYKVEWQGTGPAVQVSFEQNGKTVTAEDASGSSLSRGWLVGSAAWESPERAMTPGSTRLLPLPKYERATELGTMQQPSRSRASAPGFRVSPNEEVPRG